MSAPATKHSALITPEELAHARAAGARRSRAGRTRNGQHRYGWRPSSAEQRETDEISAVAEYLVAKITGRRWLSDGTTPDDPLAGDVEGGLQVRWTPLPSGNLIVHEPEYDPPQLTYVLVRGPVQALEVAGWQLGSQCQKRRFWREDVRHPAYFVPHHALNPIRSIDKSAPREPGSDID